MTTDIQIPNATTIDHRTHQLCCGDAMLDKTKQCEYNGTRARSMVGMPGI